MKLRFWRRHDEIPVVELSRANPVRAGVIMIIALAVVVYFGFTKKIPFKHGYTIHAEFASAQDVHPKSPVRVAGVNVGQVTSIKREGKTGLVTMEIEPKRPADPLRRDDEAPPPDLPRRQLVHRPAAGQPVRARTSLRRHDPDHADRGPGADRPGARRAQHGHARKPAALPDLLRRKASPPTRRPRKTPNRNPKPAASTRAQALNKTYRIAPPSLQGTAVVQQAFGGVTNDDLSKLVASIGKVTSALNVHEQALGELIVNFNTFFAAFASQSKGLTKLVSELPRNLRNIKEAFEALQSSFGPTQTFAHDIIPGVEQTNATVAATLPWIKQVQASLGPNELGGVASGLVEGGAAAGPARGRTGARSTRRRTSSTNASRT